MKKKILFLINTLRDGGAEKILVDVVNNLDPNKYDIEVRLIYRRGVYLNKLNDNIKLTYITGKPGTFWAVQVSRLLPRLASELLHKIFIKDKYDVEIAFLEGYATKIVAGAPKGTKTLAWVHCDLTKTEWITGVHKTERGFIQDYQKIDEVVCVSESVKEAFIQRFGEVTKLTVKYNPVDERTIKAKSLEKIDITLREGRKILLTIGRLTPPKKIMRLLHAVNHLLQEQYLIELWIIGEGEERGQLESFVSENNLEEYVRFMGYQKNPYPYIKKADLYVCSSIYEGFSTAVTEALVLGTPVLTTDVSGMRELLGDSAYGMITPNDDTAFEHGLRKMLDDQVLFEYYREMAKKRSTYFEMEVRMQEIEKLL